MSGKFTIERTVDYDEDDCPTVSDGAMQEYYRSIKKPDNTILYAIIGAIAGIVIVLLMK